MVAMSGGVDSAAAALLLRRAGAGVVGVTMRLYDAGAAPGRSCCSPATLAEAASLAASIGVPHYVLDFRDEFRAAVVEDFVAEYGRGRTPNPCVRCNALIKFDLLLARARAMGFDALATGHYVRAEYDAGRGGPVLRRGRDAAKDQSYFLWATPRPALPYLLFPVGGLMKAEVRALLAEVAPAAAAKAESQDVCFADDGDHASFLGRVLGEGNAPGPIVDEDGQTLGQHRGLAFYTIGQRRGLGVSGETRRYVKEIALATNTLVLAAGPALECRTLRVAGVNWLVPPAGDELRAVVMLRYRDPGATASLTRVGDDAWRVEFERPRRAIAPGQSAAFYDGDVLLGGGVIGRTEA